MFKTKIQSQTVRDVVKVLTGNIVAQGLAFLATVLVSRDLGPARYGDFALIVAIFTFCTQLSDFGTSTSYVRFLARHRDATDRALGSLVTFKLLTGSALGVLIWFSAPMVSEYFFDTDAYVEYFRCTALALVFHSILTSFIAHLQGLERFRSYSLLSIAHHGIRLVSMLAITFGLHASAHFQYFLYAYFFVAALLVIVLLVSWRVRPVMHWAYIREIYSLGFWVFLSSVAVILMMRIDVVMLQKLGDPVQTGLYSAASNLAMVFPLVTMSITATLMPKMDGFLRDHSVREFIRRTGRLTKYVLGVCLALELASPLVIKLMFGEAYRDSTSVFGILLVSYMFGIVINPISLIYYQVNRAYILTLVNWGQLLIGYVCNLILIPRFGADGAAMSSVLLHVFSSSIIVGYLYVVQPTLPATAAEHA
jgi:O-antigen/teichoic acid export membrane protein